MFTRILPLLAVALLAAGSAQAQIGGGGGGGGHGHRGQRSPDSSAPPPGAPAAPTPKAPTPVDQIEIVGVIKTIDAASGRVTIAYDAVDALNWPAGTKPFEVEKSALLNGASVGEKVRFKLESQQIWALRPF